MLSIQEISELISNSTEGLPYPVLALILKIQKGLNEKTGIIEIESLQRLQREMWVERVQGRKVESVKKETIRSYLRTMHKCSKGLIQVTTTKHKKIQVFFPLVKKAYENIVVQNKEYAQNKTSKTTDILIPARRIEVKKQEDGATHSLKLSASNAPINKNINKNINKKISIWVEFERSETTIEASLLAGFNLEFIEEQTQRFINWNLANESKYSVLEWQSVFRLWLENTAKYNTKQQQEKTNTRKTGHVSGTANKKQYKSTVDEVYANIEIFNKRAASQQRQPRFIDESFFEARDL